MRLHKLSVILLALAVVAGTTCIAQTWDATKDFDSINPHGPWSYGSGVTGTSFTLYPIYKPDCGSHWDVDGVVCWTTGGTYIEPFVGFNTTANWINFWTVVLPPGVLYVHPGAWYSDQDTIVRWTAPTEGTFRISGFFEILDVIPTGIIGLVFRNGTPVFRAELLGPPAQYPDKIGGRVNFSFIEIHLKAGDVISFGVNRDGDYFYDSTGFNATITRVPSPCSACFH